MRTSGLESTPSTSLRTLQWSFALRVIAVSSFIAVFLALMAESLSALWQDLIISNAMGLCVWLSIYLIMSLGRGRLAILPATLIAVPIGLFLGGKTATLLGTVDVIGQWIRNPAQEWKWISLSVLFSISASTFLIVSARAADYRVELESERRRSAEAGRSQAVAELALLQAQIEPHFLFNTLAHIQSAIDQDPALGKSMLEHLNRYLRGTLRRSRHTNFTLRQEQELVEALLAIAAIRLGERLRYAVRLAGGLQEALLPPLLLQPLVENAIKHGIEPSIDGGVIFIDGELDQDTLVLRVSDTGVGLAMHAPEGIGLSNVRARLASLFGDSGRLTLERNAPRGLIAELRLPYRTS
jgi:hypothetical protein